VSDVAMETSASLGGSAGHTGGRPPGAHRGTAIWPSTTQTVFRQRRRRAGSGGIEGVETQEGGGGGGSARSASPVRRYGW